MARRVSEVALANAVSAQLAPSEVQPVSELGALWIYERGIWRPTTREFIHQAIMRMDSNLSHTEREGIIRTLLNLRLKPDFFLKARSVVVFNDCTVEVSAEGLRARAHDPEDRARHCLPFPCPFPIPKDWGPEIPKEKLEPTPLYCRMTEAAGEATELLEQFLGATLLGIAARFKKAVIVQGEAHAGKSQWGELFRFLVAPPALGSAIRHWVSSVSPEEMFERFAPYRLVNSRLNLIDDADDTLMRTGRLKSAISGGTITAEQKFGGSFVFQPTCSWLILTNHAPRVDELGLIERFLLVEFSKKYEIGSTAIPELGKRVAVEEGAYVASRALLGAVKLLKEGFYTLPPSVKDASRDWLEESDWTRRWKADRCIEVPEPETSARALYLDASDWASSRGHKVMSETLFARRLKVHTPWKKTESCNRYHLRLAPRSPDHVDL